MHSLVSTTIVISLVIVVSGALKLLFVPLSAWFSIAEWRRREERTLLDEEPLVSIVVPGYNEELVLVSCVESILRSDYPHLDVILVDDGSSDGTFALMKKLADQHPTRVRAITQPNAGKGAALNRGARLSRGEVLMFVDSDGLFGPSTVRHMLRGFNHPSVGAVSGDDRPVNLNTVQTRLLALISHVGTGLVRRALTVLGCLPIVSGNAGAFRLEALLSTGLLREDTIGEDLELTWRMHREGWRVRFAPRALVHAESPSTVRGLWKQRVRWARGLLQVTRIHWRMIGNLRYGTFGLFLVYNTLTMILVPVLQIVVLLMLVPLASTQPDLLPTDLLGFLLWAGILVSVALLLYSLLLNNALADLRHVWTLPLWPVYAVFVSLTLIWALVLEARKEPARWNKLERSGVVSVAQ